MVKGQVRIHSKLREALDDTGLPWEITLGGNHLHIRINGRLAGVMPKDGWGSERGSALRKTIAQIRRMVRTLCACDRD